MKVAESKKYHRQKSLSDTFFSLFRKNDLPIVDVIPYKRITDEDYLVDGFNEYQAYLKVTTTDLISLNASDLKKFIHQLSTLCRLYTDCFKILSMTYPTETKNQQLYWKSKISEYRKKLLRNLSDTEYKRYQSMLKLASDNLRRVTWVEEQLSELTFFIVVYGKNKKELDNHVRDMIRFGGKPFSLKLVRRDELEKIVFKLNNMNTEI